MHQIMLMMVLMIGMVLIFIIFMLELKVNINNGIQDYLIIVNGKLLDFYYLIYHGGLMNINLMDLDLMVLHLCYTLIMD